MRVLHVAPTVTASDGTSVAVLAMLRALGDQKDIDVHLLLGEYDGLALHAALPRDSSVQILRVLQPLGGHLGYTVGYPHRFNRTLAQLAASADLVHLHGLWLYPTLFGGPILRHHHRPYVLSLHGGLMTNALVRSRIKKSLALALFERRNIEQARVVIATSQTELDQVRSLGFSVPGAVVPLAVDPAAAAFLSSHSRAHDTVDHTDEPREPTILCVSRFHPQKRLVEVVRAFGLVSRLFPEWRLRILGPDYERGYRAKVLTAAQESGFADRISVEPAIDGERLWRAYLDADLFVQASTFESFGLVIAEALAAGVPVIAPRGAPWPQLTSEQCGWWIDPSLQTLESTLREAMSLSRQTRRKMGQRGLRLIERDFSIQALGSGLAALYQSVV